MNNQIQFTNEDPFYTVTVLYSPEESKHEVASFEATRISSLESKNIEVPSEIRTWDSARKISISTDRR